VLRYRIGVFHFGSEFLAEQRQAAEERRRLETAQSELRLELVRQDTQRQLVQEQLWAERDRLRARAHAEGEERRKEAEVKERLRQLKLEAARERLQDTLSPLEEGARQLHATVFEAAVAIRESLRKNRALHGSSARRVRDLAQWFTVMSVTRFTQIMNGEVSPVL
jgi:chromosome segregation ATPase